MEGVAYPFSWGPLAREMADSWRRMQPHLLRGPWEAMEGVQPKGVFLVTTSFTNMTTRAVVLTESQPTLSFFFFLSSRICLPSDIVFAKCVVSAHTQLHRPFSDDDAVGVDVFGIGPGRVCFCGWFPESRDQ